jgi:hypothetical protein
MLVVLCRQVARSAIPLPLRKTFAMNLRRKHPSIVSE